MTDRWATGVAAAALATLTLAAVAGAASSRAVTLTAPLVGLASDGDRVAAAVASRPGDCAHVVVWTPALRTVRRLGRKHACGPVTSTGRGLAGPAFATPRALWLTYAGGNIREWSLWTATDARPAPQLLRFVARDVDEPPPIVIGEGDAAMVPYALDDVVYEVGPPGGVSRRVWQAPERVVAVSGHQFTKADLEGYFTLAVALESGTVAIVDQGSVVATVHYTPPVTAVRLGRALAVQHGQTLSMSPAWSRGPPHASYDLVIPGRWRLADAHDEFVVYTSGRDVHVVRATDARDVVVASTRGTAYASLESVGLVYGSGRRFTLLRQADLRAMFG